jgi:hypothetical protein
MEAGELVGSHQAGIEPFEGNRAKQNHKEKY